VVVVVNTLEATVVRPKRVNSKKQSSSSSSSRVVASAEQGNLPPVLQEIANDRMEFQRKLGKAMDTLRKDMQDILIKTPGMLVTLWFFTLFVMVTRGTRIFFGILYTCCLFSFYFYQTIAFTTKTSMLLIPLAFA
jgi:hypothetical protein